MRTHPFYPVQLYTWGDGAYHKLGHGDTKPVVKPKLVEALKGVKIVKVACGCVHGWPVCLCVRGRWDW